MDFNLPPPSPEQWTQAVLGLTGGAVIYGAAMAAARVKRWFGRRALEKLQAALSSEAVVRPTKIAPAEAAPPDPVVAGVLDLLTKDDEWDIAPSADKKYAYYVEHPSGAQFATDNSREVSGSDAVFAFKFGSLYLFDRTTCIGEDDTKRIRQAAWDLTSRMVRKRVLDAVPPKKEELKAVAPSGCQLSEKFGRVVHRMHADFEGAAAECVAPAAKDTGHRWVVFGKPSVYVRSGDSAGDPVWTVPQSEASNAHDAAEKFTVYAVNGGKLPVNDRGFSLWRYAATTKPHWTATSEGYGGYSWHVVNGVPLLHEAPTARFRVLRTDGLMVYDKGIETPWLSAREAVIEYVRRQTHPQSLSDAIVFVVVEGDDRIRPVGYLQLSKLLD